MSSTAMPPIQSQAAFSSIRAMGRDIDRLLSVFEYERDDNDNKGRIYGVGDSLTVLQVVKKLNLRCTMIYPQMLFF